MAIYRVGSSFGDGQVAIPSQVTSHPLDSNVNKDTEDRTYDHRKRSVPATASKLARHKSVLPTIKRMKEL